MTTMGGDAPHWNFTGDSMPRLTFLRENRYTHWVTMMWLDLLCTPTASRYIHPFILLDYVVCISFCQECNIRAVMCQYTSQNGYLNMCCSVYLSQGYNWCWASFRTLWMHHHLLSSKRGYERNCRKSSCHPWIHSRIWPYTRYVRIYYVFKVAPSWQILTQRSFCLLEYITLLIFSCVPFGIPCTRSFLLHTPKQ